ncbi:BgTH12-00025, partial [Blumeria graminis f. sp. triticale]
MYHNHSRDAT